MQLFAKLIKILKVHVAGRLFYEKNKKKHHYNQLIVINFIHDSFLNKTRAVISTALVNYK